MAAVIGNSVARGIAAAGRSARPVTPLLIVNAFAVLGQYLTGLDNYSPADWTPAARIAVAAGAALGVESISLYVQWHAHDALLMGATHTAARMRRGAYLIAFGVAAISYHHFADGWLHPTPASVVFALFSAVSPWLWGLHTRRANRIQLLREGQVDSTGAVFSAERWRAFPIRTWRARRWSIDWGVTDPREAWRDFNASLDDTATDDAEQVTAEPPTVDVEQASPPAAPRLVALRPQIKRATGRPRKTHGVSDADALAAARRWAATHGRLPQTRAERREATGTGGDRAERLAAQLRDEQNDQRTGTDR